VRPTTRIAVATLLVSSGATAAIAQPPRPIDATTGIVRVRVFHDTLPVEAAVVRSGETAALTNDGGIAMLRLVAGSHAAMATRLGVVPDTLRLVVRGGLDTTVVAQ